MCITYIRFYNHCKVQGLDRKQFPYYGYLQPYCAYFGLAWMFTVACIYGYTTYLPWSTSTFFSNYTMQLFIPWLFIIWKVVHKTKFVRSKDADLVWEKPIIDAYEMTFLDPPLGFWKEMGHLVGIGNKKDKGANRRASVNPQDVTNARADMEDRLTNK